MDRTAVLALVICLLGFLSALPAATGLADATTTHEGNNLSGIGSEQVNGTQTVDTTAATDRSISGFTVGAAVIAVIFGGSYWHFRR